jgi:hypothetical protein
MWLRFIIHDMRTFKDFLKVDKKQPQEFVSKAGAGEWGRPESTSKYIDDTPGQSTQTYKKYTGNWATTDIK